MSRVGSSPSSDRRPILLKKAKSPALSSGSTPTHGDQPSPLNTTAIVVNNALAILDALEHSDNFNEKTDPLMDHHLSKMANMSNDDLDNYLQHIAAVKIQSIWRGHSCRISFFEALQVKFLTEMDAAAWIIQDEWKKYQKKKTIKSNKIAMKYINRIDELERYISKLEIGLKRERQNWEDERNAALFEVEKLLDELEIEKRNNLVLKDKIKEKEGITTNIGTIPITVSLESYKFEIENLKLENVKEVEKLKSEIAKKTKSHSMELSHCNSQLSTVSASLESSKNEILSCRLEIENLKLENSTLSHASQTALNHHRDELETMNKSLISSQSEIEHLKLEIQNLQNSNIKSYGIKTEYEQEKQTLQSTINSLSTSLEVKNQIANASQSLVEKLKLEIAQMAKNHSNQVSQYNSQVGTISVSLESSRNEIASLNEQIVSCKLEIENLKLENLKVVDSLKSEAKSHSMELSHCNSQLSTVSASLESSKNEITSRKLEIDNLKLENVKVVEALKSEIAQLTKSNSMELRQYNSQVGAISASLESSKNEIVALKEQVESNKLEIEKLKLENGSLLQSSQTAMKQHIEELDTLSKSLVSSQNALDAANTTISELQSEHTILKKQLKDYDPAEKSKLLAEISRLQNDIVKRAQQQNTALKQSGNEDTGDGIKDRENLMKEIQRLDQIKNVMEAERQASRLEKTKLEDQVAALQTQVNNLIKGKK